MTMEGCRNDAIPKMIYDAFIDNYIKIYYKG